MWSLDSSVIYHNRADGAKSWGGFNGSFLWAIACIQLSALHGDNLSRIPSTRRLRQVSPLHPARLADHFSGPDIGALVISFDSVDFYALCGVESVALQRSELRTGYDVCPACWRETVVAAKIQLKNDLHIVIRNACHRFSLATVGRPSCYFIRISIRIDLLCAMGVFSVVRCQLDIRDRDFAETTW